MFDSLDIAVLAEVFVLREYDWFLPHPVNNVLDLGAHWGDSSFYYAIEYPDANVYSVEPEPNTYKRLQEQTAQFSNIHPIRGALGAEGGIKKLFTSNNSLGNSFSRRSESDVELNVNTLTLSELCNQTKVKKFDLVKFDIEGAEENLFSDPINKDLSKAFIGEVHLDLMALSLEEVKEFFSGFQIETIKISDSRYILKALET